MPQQGSEFSSLLAPHFAEAMAERRSGRPDVGSTFRGIPTPEGFRATFPCLALANGLLSQENPRAKTCQRVGLVPMRCGTECKAVRTIRVEMDRDAGRVAGHVFVEGALRDIAPADRRHVILHFHLLRASGRERVAPRSRATHQDVPRLAGLPRVIAAVSRPTRHNLTLYTEFHWFLLRTENHFPL